jgi:hypothetical protein
VLAFSVFVLSAVEHWTKSPGAELAVAGSTFVCLWLCYLHRTTAWVALAGTWLYCTAAGALLLGSFMARYVGLTLGLSLGGVVGAVNAAWLVRDLYREVNAPPS